MRVVKFSWTLKNFSARNMENEHNLELNDTIQDQKASKYILVNKLKLSSQFSLASDNSKTPLFTMFRKLMF